MKRIFLGLGLLGTAWLVQAQTQLPTYVDQAVTDPARPAADTALDATRKPAELIVFAGIRPGQSVADVMPGNGYFTRIFSKTVGPDGHVYAVVPQSLASNAPQKLEPIKALAANPAYRNISLSIRPYDQLAPNGSLDAVWTSQNYHDVYGAVRVFAVPGSSGPTEAAKLDVAAFNALKPGGVYIVIDHAAKAGSAGHDAGTLHRIDPATVIAQVKAAGFTLESTSDLLANPQDTHDKLIFDPSIKGRTDKFVLKFRKPRQ